MLLLKTVPPLVRKFPVRNFANGKHRSFRETEIPVPWGHIAGKWWEPFDQRPILALHGWQDNCGTFDRLVPLLTKSVGILAIDLPGHGYSSSLPPGMFYHHMNYPIVIKQISEYFQWDRISLMGHSLGGISAYTYTMLYPEEVDFLVCIDGVKPLIAKDNAKNMAEGIQELLKYDEQAKSTDEPPSYTKDEMRKRLSESNYKSIKIDYCDYILNRNIAPSKRDPTKFYFTRDPRLKSKLILNWSQQELVEFASRITTPIFISKGLESSYYEDKKNFYEVLEVLKRTSNDLQFHYVQGTHHNHLNNPENIAGLISAFVEHHIGENRSKGMQRKQEIK